MRHHYSLPDCSAEVSSRRRPLSLTVMTQSTCRPDRRPRLVCGTRNEKTAGLGWTWYVRRCVALEHKGSCTEAGKRASLTRTPSLRVPQTERVSVGRARRSGWGPGSRDEIPLRDSTRPRGRLPRCLLSACLQRGTGHAPETCGPPGTAGTSRLSRVRPGGRADGEGHLLAVPQSHPRRTRATAAASVA